MMLCNKVLFRIPILNLDKDYSKRLLFTSAASVTYKAGTTLKFGPLPKYYVD